MIKYIALLFNTFALLVYQLLFSDGITVTQNLPASAKANNEFVVELTVNKGTTTGFAKLQQELPAGFTAVPEENHGASFTFTNQMVKFIWMSLPTENEFKVRYKVKVASGISGDKIIAGKFSYVTDNEKQAIDIAPATINIIDESSAQATTALAASAQPAAPDSVASTNESAAAAVATAGSQEQPTLSCTRKLPEHITSNFTVEIMVNKGNASGFAKLIETLPAGYTATPANSGGGSFSFTDQKVKFVWVTMPTQTEFKISYNVTVAPGTTGAGTIEGVFSYIENDETKKCVIAANTVSLEMPAESISATNVSPTKETPEAKETVTAAPPAVEQKLAENKVLTTPDIAPTPVGTVNYSVQIAALSKAIAAEKLAKKFKLTTKVKTEMSGGFTKYTTGSHDEYKNARNARELVKAKGVPGAFVVAYNGGKRITIQEALMITNQKWLP